MLKKVAVILPVKNEENFLSTCLESLLSQSCKPDKIVVVLDNCTDKTPQIAALYSKKYSTISVGSMLWSQYQGRLFRAHRIAELDNEGIRHLKEEIAFIMIANADTIYPKNYIEEALKVMKDNADCVITGWLLSGTVSGSGIVYRKSFLDKATNGLVKECANEELYMQLKAISMGYKFVSLKKIRVKLLRSTGHSDLRGVTLDLLRDGYATYSLGFPPFFAFSRATVALLGLKILAAVCVPLGYILAVFIRAHKYDVASSKAPLLWQRRKISRMLRLSQYE